MISNEVLDGRSFDADAASEADDRQLVGSDETFDVAAGAAKLVGHLVEVQ